MNLLNEYDQDRFEKVLRKEDLIDKYETRLGAYLMRLTKKELTTAPALCRLWRKAGRTERISISTIPGFTPEKAWNTILILQNTARNMIWEMRAAMERAWRRNRFIYA